MADHVGTIYERMLKRFGDTHAVRSALHRAWNKAGGPGLTPEAFEQQIAVEFANWVGQEPDGDPSLQLGQAAASVVPPAEPPQLPSEPPAPLQVTPPPFPKTSAALGSALGAFSFSSNAGNQGNPISWGAGLPHLQPTWPGQPGPTSTPGTQPSDPTPGPGLDSQPQAQADWRIVGQIIAEEIRKSLEKVFEKQIQKATAGQVPLPGNPGAPNAPRGGVTLPKIIDQMAGRLPPRLREAGKKLGRSFSNSGIGRLARKGMVALGRTKTGRGITKTIGARFGKVGGAGKAAGGIRGIGGIGGGGGLAGLAGGAMGIVGGIGAAISVANAVVDKTLQTIASVSGTPGKGILFQASQQVPFLGPVVKFAQAIDQATDRLAAWNQQVGQFSGAMNRVMAAREVAEIHRSREMGDRLSPSAAALVDAEQKRKDSEMEYTIAAGEIQNRFGTIVNNALAKIMDYGKPALVYLEGIFGIQKEMQKGKGDDLEAILNGVADWSRQQQDAAHKRLEKQRQLNGGKVG